MNVLVGHDEAVAGWVATLTGKPFHAPYQAIGLVDASGHLRGGFVFTGYNGDSIEMSLAGAACLTRGAMRAVGYYVFSQLGCSRLQIHTRCDNKLVRKLGPRFGFRFEGRARRFYGDHDGFCFAITRDDVPALHKRWRL